MSKFSFTTEDAELVATHLGIEFVSVPFTVEQLRKGMDVELEHGSHDPDTDISNDDPVVTAKIAWAHLKERSDYYEALAIMEASPRVQVAPELSNIMPINVKSSASPEYIRVGGSVFRKTSDFSPSERLPVGTAAAEVVSARMQLEFLRIFSEKMSKVFDWMILQEGMDKFEDNIKSYDAANTKVDQAAKSLGSIIGRLAQTVDEQQATIERFKLAVRELQKKKASVVLDSAPSMELTNKRKDTMQTQHPAVIKHAGHVYVLAKDDNEDTEPLEPEETEVPVDDLEDDSAEEAAELDLLSRFKQDWQTILSKLPEDLEVDEEFEAALTGIENFIQEFEQIHEDYDAEDSLPEVEEVDESEVEKLD